MHKIKTIIIATILSAFAIFSANAQVSAGLTVKGVSLDATGSESTSTDSRSETLEAILGSLFIEYSMGPVGIGVEWIPYNIESETVTNDRSGESVDTGTTLVQVDLEDNVGAYILVDLGDTGAYAKLGASYSEVITNESINTGTTYANDELIGYHVSLGMEREVMDVSMRLEATLSEYDNVQIGGLDQEGGVANTVTVNGLDGYSVGLSVLKNF